jgi:hypothetical protein
VKPIYIYNQFVGVSNFANLLDILVPIMPKCWNGGSTNYLL